MPLRVAYLGPERTNTHYAALKRFGPRARYVHAPTIDDVFHEVERRQAEYGVVPVENSLEGAVTHTLDRFIEFPDTPAKIHGEIEQVIDHHLILHPGAKLSQIRTVYSHPQALAQCHRWLTLHLPRVIRQETNSTADAVSYVVDGKRDASRAAIGRQELATPHRLKAMRIPQEQENKTRFLILGMGDASKARRNKTSLMFALKDKPGALHDALVPFKRAGINLLKIESRPSRKQAWEYFFFIDMEGHEAEPRVKRALSALEPNVEFVKVLGSYPTAK